MIATTLQNLDEAAAWALQALSTALGQAHQAKSGVYLQGDILPAAGCYDFVNGKLALSFSSACLVRKTFWVASSIQ